jgi:hypothetical protein
MPIPEITRDREDDAAYAILSALLQLPPPHARSVAHQSAGFGKRIIEADHRHSVASRQRDDLDATVLEQYVGTDQQGVSPLFPQDRESRIAASSPKSS